ncbi:MAG: hypothetical protein HKN62_09860 [Phycisphaerales bacterium]|nr:hypothetical protein [Phycisphaerales bacterium]
MKSRQAVVELLPGRIDVIVFEGSRQVDARRLPLSTDGDACEWAKTVRRSGVSLQKIVEELKVEGGEARVLYRSPTQSVDLSSFGVRAPNQAIDAAVLSCADSLPYSAMSAVTEAVIVGRDTRGDPRQMHVLVAAEREDIAEAIVHLVEEAGLKFVSATPLDAAVMANFVGSELATKATHQGSLYVGEYTSFFVVSSGGTLLFDRRIDLGLESLASSLTSPLTVRGRGETIELSDEDAQTMLQNHGVPDRDAIVHEELQLTGGQVIPLLQPVLQRFIVELRQSLRFGLSEGDRSNLSIRVTGPGASIPGLTDLIGKELGVETRADDGYSSTTSWTTPGATEGELRDALKDPKVLQQLNLLPKELNQHRRFGRLRRWLWTGAAAALAMIALDGVRQHARLRTARDQAAVYASQIADLEALEQNVARLRSVMEATNALDATIREEVGLRVDLAACLKELSLTTPQQIRLLSMNFARDGSRTGGIVRGFAYLGDEGRGTGLDTFIEQLRDSPLFTSVELGNVTMGAMHERKGERFEATFTIVGMARGLERTADATEETTP